MLKQLTTFVRYMRKVQALFDSIYKPVNVSNFVVSVKVDSQFVHKMSDLRYPLTQENMMMWGKERHPLLLKWFITFL